MEGLARPLTREEMAAIRDAARNERTVRARFWRALRRLARNTPFARELAAAFFCATDPTTEFRVRAVLFGALAYFVMPLDALPDVLPFIGFTDDAAVLAIALRTIVNAMRPEHYAKAENALRD